MRGLSLTRKFGEHIVLLTKNNNEEEIVAAIITLIEFDRGRVRLQIQADPAIIIRRFEGPLE